MLPVIFLLPGVRRSNRYDYVFCSISGISVMVKERIDEQRNLPIVSVRMSIMGSINIDKRKYHIDKLFAQCSNNDIE